jgi:murein DD-endopeptidase MepM/ murein hydrolase activator NlpD
MRLITVLLLLLFLVACSSQIEQDITVKEVIPQESYHIEKEEITLEEEKIEEEIEEEIQERIELISSNPIFVWPSDSTSINSAFGPRLKSSEDYRYDFHRALDIEHDLSSKIYAVEEGEVFRLYTEGEEGSPYPNGGNVIIMEHEFEEPFSFHGEKFTTYYTHYLHLDSIDVILGQTVNQAEVIGTMGSSGTTNNVHLHFEVRIGTHCSYDYQANNPESGCSLSPPIDPHVNPLLFLPYDNEEEIKIEVVDENPLKIKISTSLEELDFNSINVVKGSKEEKINLNTREGINVRDIDEKLYEGVLIEPTSLVEEYEIFFTFQDFNSYDSIKVTDIFGNVNSFL